MRAWALEEGPTVLATDWASAFEFDDHVAAVTALLSGKLEAGRPACGGRQPRIDGPFPLLLVTGWIPWAYLPTDPRLVSARLFDAVEDLALHVRAHDRPLSYGGLPVHPEFLIPEMLPGLPDTVRLLRDLRDAAAL